MKKISALGKTVLQSYKSVGYEIDNFLNPGLDASYIDELTKKENIELPVRLKNFYQWRNGTNFANNPLLREVYFLPLCYYILSLEKAIRIYQELRLLNSWENSWFPVLSDEAGVFFVIDIVDDNQVEGSILYTSPEEGTFAAFQDLFQMLLTIDKGIKSAIISLSPEKLFILDYKEWGKLGRQLNPRMEYWTMFQ